MRIHFSEDPGMILRSNLGVNTKATTISHRLFAHANAGIHPHAASPDQGVTDLSHAQTIFVTLYNVSTALK